MLSRLAGRVTAWVSFAIGLVLVIAGTAATYFSIRDHQLRSSYERAPACVSQNDAVAGKNCRYRGAATVVRVSEDGGTASVYFFLVGFNDRFFIARYPQFIQPDVRLSDQVDVELWSGRVTRLGDGITADNPETLPEGPLLTIGLLLAGIGLVATLGPLRVLRNRRSGIDDSMTPLAAMNPIATSDALWH